MGGVRETNGRRSTGAGDTGRRWRRRFVGVVALAMVAASCGGGGSGDDGAAQTTLAETGSTAEPAATVAPPSEPSAPATTTAPVEVEEAPSGEILLEPIGVAMPEAFSPTMVTVDEQLPEFELPEFLTTGGTDTPDPNAEADDPGTETDGAEGGNSILLTPIAGNVPGLYGGTRDVAACDQPQMIEFLEQNPDKGAAWAAVHDLEVTEIREYLKALTAVILLSDTRVTNHGFADGAARPHQSVLQAGHAVLVDEFGVPRAKCSCGNPLAPPEPVPVAPEFVGTTWPGFDPTDIVVVIATDAVGDGFVIVDLGTGDLITRPIGYAPDAVDADVSALLDTGNRLGVQPGAAFAPSFTVEAPTLIVAIVNYHYGPETPPGQIGLTREDGTFYGPWQTTGREGQGGVADAYWTAIPWEIVPAGTYTVYDSEPSTWSTNDDAGGAGFSVVRGVVGVALPPAPGSAEAPPPAVDPIEQAAARYLEIVAPRNCAMSRFGQAFGTAPGMEDGVIDEAEYAAFQAHMAPHYELARDAVDYFAAGLNSTQWPPEAQALADRLAPEVLAEASSLDAERTMSYADWVVYQPVVADGALVQQMRSAIGLPPPDGTRDWCADVAS